MTVPVVGAVLHSILSRLLECQVVAPSLVPRSLEEKASQLLARFQIHRLRQEIAVLDGAAMASQRLLD